MLWLLEICMTAQIIWTLTSSQNESTIQVLIVKRSWTLGMERPHWKFISIYTNEFTQVIFGIRFSWHFVFWFVFEPNEIFRKTLQMMKYVLTSGRSKPMGNGNKYIKHKIYHSQTLNWNTGETMWVENVCGFFAFKNESY